jgi:cation transport ATPase
VHNIWQVLRWTRLAIVIAYCLLAAVASKRLNGREKKLNGAVLIVIAILVAVQIWIQHAFGGLLYRFAMLFVGVAAGVAALVVAAMLIEQPPRDRSAEAGSNDRIQSLKLN